MITTEARRAIATTPYIPPTRKRVVDKAVMCDWMLAHPSYTMDDLRREFTDEEIAAHAEPARQQALTRSGGLI